MIVIKGDMSDAIQTTPIDPLKVSDWPITELRAKKLKDAFNELI
jgi:hypothetical protein